MVWRKKQIWLNQRGPCRIDDNVRVGGWIPSDNDKQYYVRKESMNANGIYYTPPYNRQDERQQQQSPQQYCRHYQQQQQQFSDNSHLQRQCPCAQFRCSQQEQVQSVPRMDCSQRQQQQASASTLDFQLYDPTPSSLIDKHYRGSHYSPGHPLGVQVPEEIARVRETRDGPVRIPCEEHMSHTYLPLYRYKDWVERSEIEVWQDCNTTSLLCRLPDVPTQHWDFYNEVRMRRSTQKLPPRYGTCRALPIPRDTDLEDVPVYDPCPGLQGTLNDYSFREPIFQPSNLCRC
ncbi:hypothetical protein RRG08_041596 [Elysia crispata]|uniref:Uncharacterized protein n=1 Tax=Elysia crispata TaxID=231223 RepID=A0AAE1AYL9_9GAST|nr:hypothetical protein RRG08_041596 [Elysia crispata]